MAGQCCTCRRAGGRLRLYHNSAGRDLRHSVKLSLSSLRRLASLGRAWVDRTVGTRRGAFRRHGFHVFQYGGRWDYRTWDMGAWRHQWAVAGNTGADGRRLFPGGRHAHASYHHATSITRHSTTLPSALLSAGTSFYTAPSGLGISACLSLTSYTCSRNAAPNLLPLSPVYAALYSYTS